VTEDRRSVGALLALVVTLCGCGGKTARLATDKQAGDGAAEPDAAGPLLERAGELRYDCVVSQPAAILTSDVLQETWLGATADVAYVAANHFERIRIQIWSIRVWPLDYAAGLGPPAVSVRTYDRLLDGAVADDRFTLLWRGTKPTTQLMLLQFDGAGTLITAPKAVLEPDPGPEEARLAWRDSGYLAAWDDSVPDAGPAKLRVLLLDEMGDAVNSPSVVAEGDDLSLGSLVATETGYALTYSTLAADGSSSIRYQALDGTAAASGPAYELGPTDGELMTSLLAHEAEVVVAWTQCEGETSAEQQQCAVALRRMDERGGPVGPTYALDTPREGELDGRVALVGFGEDIALIWSHGTVDDECIECMPHYNLRFAMLDGTKLTPASEILTLQIESHHRVVRLTRPQGVLLGNDVFVVSDVDFDEVGSPASRAASGAIRCTRTS
jgi:hypothetical protein